MINEFIAYTDTLRIRQHLKRVEHLLRSKDVKILPPSLQQARIVHLDHLRDYWQRGIFPHNTSHAAYIPCFIDHAGRQCAVAHLMIKSGEIEAAHRIAETANNAYVEDMHFPELTNWAARSGLSKKELALIQPAYCPEAYQNEVGIGLWLVGVAAALALIGMLPALWSWVRLILRNPLGYYISHFGLGIGAFLSL